MLQGQLVEAAYAFRWQRRRVCRACRQSPAKSCATQRRVYAGVGDVVTVVEALGVDPEQHFDAVPGALGDPRRGHPRA